MSLRVVEEIARTDPIASQQHRLRNKDAVGVRQQGFGRRHLARRSKRAHGFEQDARRHLLDDEGRPRMPMPGVPQDLGDHDLAAAGERGGPCIGPCTVNGSQPRAYRLAAAL